MVEVRCMLVALPPQQVRSCQIAPQLLRGGPSWFRVNASTGGGDEVAAVLLGGVWVFAFSVRLGVFGCLWPGGPWDGFLNTHRTLGWSKF